MPVCKTVLHVKKFQNVAGEKHQNSLLFFFFFFSLHICISESSFNWFYFSCTWGAVSAGYTQALNESTFHVNYTLWQCLNEILFPSYSKTSLERAHCWNHGLSLNVFKASLVVVEPLYIVSHHSCSHHILAKF